GGGREGGGRGALQGERGGLQGVAVLERVLLERDRGDLACEPLARGPRRDEVQAALEQVPVDRGGPVVVGQVPSRRPDQQLEVGEEEERVHAPGLVPGRVDAGRQRVQAVDGGRVPRAQQAGAQPPPRRPCPVQG